MNGLYGWGKKSPKTQNTQKRINGEGGQCSGYIFLIKCALSGGNDDDFSPLVYTQGEPILVTREKGSIEEWRVPPCLLCNKTELSFGFAWCPMVYLQGPFMVLP